ncbi:conserved hypothetical protein [Exiguobacterium oxidotolerans]|uniref:Uncharacterized protein n=1 Tax=Exiguobacterium oxidotolerans TaxID=223958 RepID=A0A653I8M9_9BACL|nr:conserved hypothetical protein [Exiguobacterium oxidotolerans]
MVLNKHYMAAIVAIVLSAVLLFSSAYETKVGAVMLAICVGALVKFTADGVLSAAKK